MLELERTRSGASVLKARIVRKRGYKCEKCGSTDRVELHHKQRITRHGTHDESNLILLCRICHGIETNLERGGLSLYMGA